MRRLFRIVQEDSFYSEEQHLRTLRRSFLIPQQMSHLAIAATAESDQVRLGNLNGWPDASAFVLLSHRRRVPDVAPPARPLRRMVRVDEGVIEFHLQTLGDLFVLAAGFFDRTPTFGQYELALRKLVDYQELNREPSWFPDFDRAKLL